jgi:hypothetical protein
MQYYAGGDAPRPLQNEAAIRFGQGVMQSIPEYERGPILNAATRTPELTEAYRRNVVYPAPPGGDSYYSPGFIQTDAQSAQHELTHAVYYEQLTPEERAEFLATVFQMAQTDPFIAQVIQGRKDAVRGGGAGVDPQHIYTYFQDIGRIPPQLQKFYSRQNVAAKNVQQQQANAAYAAAEQQRMFDEQERERQRLYGARQALGPPAPLTPQARQALPSTLQTGFAGLPDAETIYGAGALLASEQRASEARAARFGDQGAAVRQAELAQFRNVRVDDFPSYEAAEAEAQRRAQMIDGVRLIEADQYRPAVPHIPYSEPVREAVGEGIRATAPVVERLPYIGPLQQIGERLPHVPTPTGVLAGVGEQSVPTDLLQLELMLVPGIGEVPGGISFLNQTIRKSLGEVTESSVKRFVASEAGQKFADDVARVATGTGRKLAGETGSVALPGARVLDQPAVEYIEPPPISRLADEADKTLLVAAQPEQVAAKAAAETRGGVVRGIGRVTADAVSEVLTHLGDRPGQLAQKIRGWLTSEANRFDRPLREAVARYWRDVTASRVWATEQGAQIGRRMKDTFGKPNAVFIGADGQPVFFADSTGAYIKLTNRDAVENFHLFADRMTPEQLEAARSAGEFMNRMRGEARDRGVRLGTSRDLADGEVQSYVHRSTIEKDGTYFAEYGDPQRPGAHTSMEESRDYVTAAEGMKNGVRYSDAWDEEYIAALAGLRRRMSDSALKEWTDAVSETLTQRMLRKYPTEAAARAAANTARADANRILKARTAEIQKRYRARATKSVAEARRAVLKAQRALDRATSTASLDKTTLRQPDAMKIGKARERLAAAVKAGNKVEIKRAQAQLDGLTTQQALQTQVVPRDKLINDVGRAREQLAAANKDMNEAANLSVDALYRRLDDSDRIALQQAKADVELTEQGAKAANKAWGKKALNEKDKLAPDFAPAPGGASLPITSGRIFEAEDAQVMRELAEDMQHHPDNALITIMRVPVRALNLVTLTVDNSFFGVQGMFTALTRPFKWAAAAAQAPISALPAAVAADARRGGALGAEERGGGVRRQP